MIQTPVLVILLLAPGQADPTNPPSEKAIFAELSADERLAQLKQEAAEYELFLDTAAGKKLILGEPVLRFNDQVSGVVDAVQLIWRDGERAEATASFWRRKDGLIAHEFQSLSESRVLAKLDDRTLWHPLTPGVQPKLLDGAPKPAKTAPGRSSQTRTAARKFTASVVNRTGDRSLRLLSQPVSRHGTANTPVLDAAWFAFAKGTNPEVMVLIEARRLQDDVYAWHYSPVRMTSAECKLERDGLVVWNVPRDRGNSPGGTYFNIYARE